MSSKDMKELYKLLNALREDVITDEQFDRLDQMISGDHQACQIYVDYVRLWADLVGVQAAAKPGLDQTLALSGPMDVDDLSNSKLWQALAEDEKNAIASPGVLGNIKDIVDREKRERRNKDRRKEDKGVEKRKDIEDTVRRRKKDSPLKICQSM